MHRLSRLAPVSWLAMVAIVFAARDASAAACATPADCLGNTPICHAFVCVPCATDHGTGLVFDCTDPAQPICQTSGSIGGACTQCGAGKTALCDADHPTCLADGTCGCTVSTDCSGGRTCDTTTHTCTPPVVDAGASDGGGSSDGGSNDGSSSDGAAIDGSTTDGGSNDGAANDGSASDGSPSDAASDGASSTDGGNASHDGSAPAGEAGSGDGGPLLDGAYVEGGGCACTAGANGTSNGLAALSAIGAIVVLQGARRRRRSR